MKKKGKQINNNSDQILIKMNIIVSIFVVVVLAFLSVGYALYSAVVNITGTLGFGQQGSFGITSVIRSSAVNTDNGLPTFTDDSIDFNLTFVKSNDPNATYSAVYDITFTNDTFYDQVVTSLDFSFEINDQNGDPMGTIDFNVVGIEDGGVVEKLSSQIVTVTINFTPSVDSPTYEVEGGGEVQSNEKPEGNLIASLVGSTSGDIRNDAIAGFTVNVINTYVSPVTFTIATISDKVVVCDQNGNALGSYTISGSNEGQNYSFYIKAASGAQFPDDTLTTTVVLYSTGLPNTNAGAITLDVDKVVQYVDSTPPTISGVTAVQSNEVGVVNLSWSGVDDYSGVKKYYIQVCDGNGTMIREIDTNSDSTSYAVTGLSPGASASTYIFKVYGEDNDENIADANDISDATTAAGPCSASASDSYQWVFTVSYSISNGSSRGNSTANIHDSYTGTISANSGYDLPSSITVRMGNTQINSGYTYNSNDGSVVIDDVTGNIQISATCNRSCLIEGTEILLANGKYKKVEDINYTDLMAVWSYDTGSLVYEYPVWIETAVIRGEYLETTFSDGTTLGTIEDHAVYNYDVGRFVSVLDRENYHVGSTISKIVDGKIQNVKITKLETIYKTKKAYNIISSRYFNVIANNVLTTDRNIMISNQYGFTNKITWPGSLQWDVSHNPDHLYDYKEFSEFMPYYIYKGLRVAEGKYVVDLGYTTLEELKYYLKKYPANPSYYVKVPENSRGKRMWTVTTDFDLAMNLKPQYEEGSYYTLKRDKNILCYHNNVDHVCYSPGSKVQVYSGIHFETIYRNNLFS